MMRYKATRHSMLAITSHSEIAAYAPLRSAQKRGPASSKLRSALRLVTVLDAESRVAKLHLKAISPGCMSMPAPMLSKAPRPL